MLFFEIQAIIKVLLFSKKEERQAKLLLLKLGRKLYRLNKDI